MHPNKAFRTRDDAQNLKFVRDRAFGVLAVSVEDAPLISHIPILVSEDGTSVDLHLVRSNPIVRALKTALPARIAVSGPDSYVSPDWYGASDQVPTWNYVAVHLIGQLELRPQDELPALLEAQSDYFEERLFPKPPWKSSKLGQGVLEKMMRMIVPCRMAISSVDGTWKLNQNKPDEVRLNAARHVNTHGIGQEIQRLAAMMRGPDSDTN